MNHVHHAQVVVQILTRHEGPADPDESGKSPLERMADLTRRIIQVPKSETVKAKRRRKTR